MATVSQVIQRFRYRCSVDRRLCCAPTVREQHHSMLANHVWAGCIRIRIGGITLPALSCPPILTLAHHGATRCMREIGGMTTDKARRTAFPKDTTTSGECRALLSHASQAGRVAPGVELPDARPERRERPTFHITRTMIVEHLPTPGCPGCEKHEARILGHGSGYARHTDTCMARFAEIQEKTN